MGPASLFRASSSIVDPGPLPWAWIWDFIETVDNRTILSVTKSSSVSGPIAYRYLYNDDLTTPSALVHSAVVKDGTPMRINVRLVNDLGQQVDTGVLQTIPWQASVQQHFDIGQLLKAAQTTGGFTPSDRDLLELIRDAVYRTWPDA